jgi:hypothetical protein
MNDFYGFGGRFAQVTLAIQPLQVWKLRRAKGNGFHTTREGLSGNGLEIRSIWWTGEITASE